MKMTERVLLTRQAIYRFCAGSLLCPEAARLDALKAGTAWLAEVFDAEQLAARFESAGTVRELVSWVLSFDGDLPGYQAEWVRLFGCSRDGYCFPYEGAYRGAQAAGPLLTELLKEYARAGLAMSANDLPDHISVALEYIPYLCGLELETLRSKEDARRSRIVRAQYMFLENHLCRWLPALHERVARNNGSPFALICKVASTSAARDHLSLSSMAETAVLAMQPSIREHRARITPLRTVAAIELSPQGGRIDAKPHCGFPFVAIGSLQHTHYVRPFRLPHRFSKIVAARFLTGLGRIDDVPWKVGRLDYRSFTNDESSLDDVLQLAYVPGPIVAG